MSYTRSEYPQWCWSSSRKSTFKECPRKYFYNYYLSHNGWEDDAPQEAKQAYRLKKLTGIHLLLGSAVHEVAEYACKIIAQSKRVPEEKELTDKVRYILNQAWKESKQPELWSSKPGQYLMLHEFYYGNGLSDAIIKKVKDKMSRAVPNLISSQTIKELTESRKIIIAEDMDTFDLFDTPIYAVPDLVFEKEDGNWVVVDWKTGKEHDSHPSQINVYCLYLINKFGVKSGNIKGRVEYLLTGRCVDVEITEETLRECKSDIEKSLGEMREYLEDPEINKPLSREEFPMAKHTRLCEWCNFYEICEDELVLRRLNR